MSKEFETAINALRHAGDALKNAGSALTSAGNALASIAELFEQRIGKPELIADRVIKEVEAEQDTKEAEQAKPEEPATTPSKADVKALLVSKSRDGHTDDVKALLHKYGASSVTEIMQSDRLAEFYKEAEVIGNAG